MAKLNWDRVRQKVKEQRAREGQLFPVSPRRCSICGKTYHRRNLQEVWDVRNPGRRIGWHKEVIKTCMNCLSKQQALRIISIAIVKKDDVSGNEGGAQ